MCVKATTERPYLAAFLAHRLGEYCLVNVSQRLSIQQKFNYRPGFLRLANSEIGARQSFVGGRLPCALWCLTASLPLLTRCQ